MAAKSAATARTFSAAAKVAAAVDAAAAVDVVARSVAASNPAAASSLCEDNRSKSFSWTDAGLTGQSVVPGGLLSGPVGPYARRTSDAESSESRKNLSPGLTNSARGCGWRKSQRSLRKSELRGRREMGNEGKAGPMAARAGPMAGRAGMRAEKILTLTTFKKKYFGERKNIFNRF